MIKTLLVAILTLFSSVAWAQYFPKELGKQAKAIKVYYSNVVDSSSGDSGKVLMSRGTNAVPSWKSLTALPNSALANSAVTVTAGTGLSTGGSVSLGSSVTLNLANTAVSAGSYTSANITVDAQGRLTAAANGSGGSGYGAWTGQGQVTGSDFTTSSATLADVTGLSFAAAANTTYEIEAWLDCLMDANTGGMRFAVNSTGGSPTVYAQMSSASSSVSAASNSTVATNGATISTVLSYANAAQMGYIRAIVKSGTGTPTISIQVRASTAGQLATIKIGSKMLYRVQ